MLTRAAILACALATPTSPQVSASLQTETAVGVAANYSVQSLAPGTPEAGLSDLWVESREGLFLGPATMALRFGSHAPLHRRITWTGTSSRGYFAGFSGVARSLGDDDADSQSLLWTLRGRSAGTLILDLRASIDSLAPLNTARIDIDVGADGSIDFPFDLGIDLERAQILQIPVVIPAADPTLPVRITTTFRLGGSVSRTAYRSVMTCDLSFVPGIRPTRRVDIGIPCGAELRAADRVATGQHALAFELHDALPNEAAAFVFGSRQVALPIGASGCILHVEPVGVVFTTADALGFASTGFVLPAPIADTTAFVQAFSLETGTGQGNEDWEASQGLRIDFIDPR